MIAIFFKHELDDYWIYHQNTDNFRRIQPDYFIKMGYLFKMKQ